MTFAVSWECRGYGHEVLLGLVLLLLRLLNWIFGPFVLWRGSRDALVFAESQTLSSGVGESGLRDSENQFILIDCNQLVERQEPQQKHSRLRRVMHFNFHCVQWINHINVFLSIHRWMHFIYQKDCH